MQEANSEMEMDGYVPYCLGIVVADKPFGVDDILVWPSGKLTMTTGDPMASDSVNKVSYTDSFGVSQTETSNESQHQQASWLRGDAEHLWTSPMVRAGESVQLYRYRDTGNIYWKTIYREPALRKSERIIFGASNVNPGDTISVDLDSLYYIDFDTLSKVLTIRTTTSGGEAFGYKLTMSGKDSFMSMTDTVGNQMGIESQANRVFMQDAVGGLIETIAGVVNLKAPGGYNIDASKINVKGPTTFEDNVTFNKSIGVAGGISMAGEGGGKAEFGSEVIIRSGLTVQGYSNLVGGHGPNP